MSGYETADAGNPKTCAAARSLAKWYRRQCHEIAIARTTARRLVESGEATQTVADEFLAEVIGPIREKYPEALETAAEVQV